MPAPFNKVVPGQSLSGIAAADWNRSMDAAKIVLGPQSGGVDFFKKGRRDRSSVVVINTTGSALAIGNIVSLNNARNFKSEFAEFLLEPVMSTGKPYRQGGSNAEDKFDVFGIITGDADRNEMTHAVVTGVAVCKIDIKKTKHHFAQVANGKTEFMESSIDGPARILWREDTHGTGQMWAVVSLAGGNEDPPKVVIKFDLTETLTSGDQKGKGRISKVYGGIIRTDDGLAGDGAAENDENTLIGEVVILNNFAIDGESYDYWFESEANTASGFALLLEQDEDDINAEYPLEADILFMPVKPAPFLKRLESYAHGLNQSILHDKDKDPVWRADANCDDEEVEE